MAHNIRAYLEYSPQIGENCFIDPQATVIGQVTLGEHCSIWPQVVLRGDVHHITVGNYSNIQDGSVVHVTRDSQNTQGHPTHIGDNVTVGHGVMLHGCNIGNNVLVGIGSIILDGAIIEDNTMIAAGTVVPPGKTLQGGYLYMGSPAKAARALTDKEMAFLPISAKNYAKLKNDYL